MLAHWSQYAALPLRLVLGALFVVLGTQKLFGYLSGPGLAGTVRSLEWAGISRACCGRGLQASWDLSAASL